MDVYVDVSGTPVCIVDGFRTRSGQGFCVITIVNFDSNHGNHGNSDTNSNNDNNHKNYNNGSNSVNSYSTHNNNNNNRDSAGDIQSNDAPLLCLFVCLRESRRSHRCCHRLV